MAQPKSQLPLYLGIAAAGGVGYYLYTAGGSPKVAEKQFESDVSRASSKLKGELPGKGNQVQKDAEKWGADVGAKMDNAADKAKQEVANAESKLEQYRKDAGKKIDAADRKVEEGASKAKSGVSSWFGGK